MKDNIFLRPEEAMLKTWQKFVFNELPLNREPTEPSFTFTKPFSTYKHKGTSQIQ